MALKIKLKPGDRLILGGAFLEVERLTFSNVFVSVEAPEDVVIFKQRAGVASLNEQNSHNKKQAQSAEHD